MAVIIVIYHYYLARLGWDSDFYFRGGYLCVDAFFVISGFLLAGMILSMPRNTSFLSWLKRRMRSIYPCYAVALFFAFAVKSYFGGLPDTHEIASLFEEVFMIHEWGIVQSNQYYNGATWYISAMMFVSCAYFILVKRFTPQNRERIIASVSALCFSVMIMYFGNIHVHGIGKGFIPKGIIRGFSGMGIGWQLFVFRDKINLKYPGALFALSVIMITVICLYAKDSYSDILIYPATALALVSSQYIAVKSPAVQRAMIFSGRMSYALYLCHMTVQTIMFRLLHEYTLMMFIVASVAGAFVLMWGVSVIGHVLAWR